MRTNEPATMNQRLRAGDFATLFSEGAEERIEPPAPARRARPLGAAANRIVARLRAGLAPAAPPRTRAT